MKPDDFLKSIDKTNFSTDSYAKRVEKPWGYEIHLAPEGAHYMAKIMHINEGKRQSLQVHDQKSETWCVLRGRVAVLLENAQGELEQIELEPDKGYTNQPGQRHRLVALTDCDVFEASIPEMGTTIRLEDDYRRPDETEEVRAQPNRGWRES
jgi:mannose-6-phosphate isomerase-like protein (cupin superfamily)